MENYIKRRFTIPTLHQIKYDEMGGARSTDGGDVKCIPNFDLKYERNIPLKKSGGGSKYNIKKGIKGLGCGV
jgi:hypothetical protein